MTAQHGLTERLCWGGVPVQKLSDGTVEFENCF